MIIQITKKESLPECLDVIHRSFKTVADEFCLYHEEKIVGYMSLSKESDTTYELHNLAVLPEYRHNGFGKSLLDYAKQTVKSLGGNIIKIGIIEESTILKKWYECRKVKPFSKIVVELYLGI